MSTMTLALQRPLARTLAAVAVGLIASLLLPLVLHLFPADAGPPLGARLLPIFYASLVLALRFGAVPALGVAVLAPLANNWLTEMPAGPMLPTLLLELTLFTLLIASARRLVPQAARYLGPVAYLAAAFIVRSLFVPDANPLMTLFNAIEVAGPGLAMLLAVGALAGGRGRPSDRARGPSAPPP